MEIKQDARIKIGSTLQAKTMWQVFLSDIFYLRNTAS